MEGSIGRYEIVRKIGAGSTATVYLGKADTGPVALKVLHKHLVLDEVIMERFRREVALARELEHETIAGIYDFISQEQQAALVMEYCAGGNLTEWSGTGAGEVPAIAVSMARALAFAHGRGIVHRDIKPENILKDAEGRIKLCDFGSAHVQNLIGITTSTMFAGTPRFIAPELLTGNYSDPRSDLYSLGAVLYQVSTGRPHRDTSVISLLRKQETAPAPAELVPGFPGWLSAIIMNLLDDIEKRIPDAETLLYLLENETAPGERRVKTCLYCRNPMAEETTLCLHCGKPELQLAPCLDEKARCLVLTKITEKAETLHHFLFILKALSGIDDLDFKFIIGDARMYSREEGKTGIRLPVRVLDNLPEKIMKELILLLKGPYEKEIQLESRSMHNVFKVKRGPLIRPGQFVKRSETAELFLARAADLNRKLPHTSDQPLFTGIAEAGYSVIRNTAVALKDERIQNLLNTLMDHIQSAFKQLQDIEAYLDSVSLGAVYNEWMRIDSMLKKSTQHAEIQALIERKQEQQRLYEKYQAQERKYTGIKNRLLEVYGRLVLLGRQEETPRQPGAGVQKSIVQLIKLFGDNTPAGLP